jgi:hypothetical protein
MPAWVDFPAGIYGTPDIDGRGVKVGIDEHGGPIDPDTDDRVPDAASLARAREWLARRVPPLADAPIVEARVCAYENTDTGDFVVDRHPAHDNVWLVGGGSGHGFKHGPAVGELTGSHGARRRAARFTICAGEQRNRCATNGLLSGVRSNAAAAGSRGQCGSSAGRAFSPTRQRK